MRNGAALATGCADASLADAIRWSCNTVMAGIGVKVGLDRMVAAAEAFGFNDTGLRIPSWVAKSNFDTEMSDDQLALSSIGQLDTAATPLQMAMVAAAVANNGEIAQPHLVERTTAGGTTVDATGRRSYRQAMRPSTTTRLQELMVRAVEDGAGTNAAIPGARVGGKTGTAQHGPGNTGTPYAWFIAWAQAPDSAQPAVAVAVVVEDGGGEPHGHQRGRGRGTDRAGGDGGGAEA